MKKKSDKIIKEMSLKYHLPVKDIEDIIKSQFKFVRETIEEAEKDNEDSFKTVKLLSFGKFLVKDKVIYHIKKQKEKKNAN